MSANLPLLPLELTGSFGEEVICRETFYLRKWKRWEGSANYASLLLCDITVPLLDRKISINSAVEPFKNQEHNLEELNRKLDFVSGKLEEASKILEQTKSESKNVKKAQQDLGFLIKSKANVEDDSFKPLEKEILKDPLKSERVRGLTDLTGFSTIQCIYFLKLSNYNVTEAYGLIMKARNSLEGIGPLYVHGIIAGNHEFDALFNINASMWDLYAKIFRRLAELGISGRFKLAVRDTILSETELSVSLIHLGANESSIFQVKVILG